VEKDREIGRSHVIGRSENQNLKPTHKGHPFDSPQARSGQAPEHGGESRTSKITTAEGGGATRVLLIVKSGNQKLTTEARRTAQIEGRKTKASTTKDTKEHKEGNRWREIRCLGTPQESGDRETRRIRT